MELNLALETGISWRAEKASVGGPVSGRVGREEEGGKRSGKRATRIDLVKVGGWVDGVAVRARHMKTGAFQARRQEREEGWNRQVKEGAQWRCHFELLCYYRVTGRSSLFFPVGVQCALVDLSTASRASVISFLLDALLAGVPIDVASRDEKPSTEKARVWSFDGHPESFYRHNSLPVHSKCWLLDWFSQRHSPYQRIQWWSDKVCVYVCVCLLACVLVFFPIRSPPPTRFETATGGIDVDYHQSNHF